MKCPYCQNEIVIDLQATTIIKEPRKEYEGLKLAKEIAKARLSSLNAALKNYQK